MNLYGIILAVVVAVAVTQTQAQSPRSATDLAVDMYRGCLKDFDTSCVQPKAMQWLSEAVHRDEIIINDKLSIVRIGQANKMENERSARDPQEKIIANMEEFLTTHALRIQPPEFFKTEEARSYVPDFLLSNALTKGALVPLADRTEGRGMVRKVLLPFLLGLKLKTTVLVPLALGLIALKTWKAVTLGLLSLVLSGALVVFKIAKPKIVNYEVVHYPHHVDHIEHIEHVPHHHVEHIVPHHLEHIVPHHLDHHIELPHHIEHHHVEAPHHVEHLELPHHVDHHLELPHHVEHHLEHLEHLEHPSPAWDPHEWSRSSQEPQQDAHNLAYQGQKKR